MPLDTDTVSVAGVVILELVKLSQEALSWFWDRVKLTAAPPLDRLTIWGCSMDALDIEKLRDAGLAVMDCPAMTVADMLTNTGRHGCDTQLIWTVPE